MKRFLAIILIFIFCLTLVACDNEIFSDERMMQYKYAMVVLPSGELVEGKLTGYFYSLESRSTFINVEVDGRWYCVHPLNVVFYE